MNQKKFYTKFLIRLLIFAAIVFLLDLGAGTILRHYYFKQSSGLMYRTTYAMDSTKADVIVMGSSRANHHYYPTVFEDSLNQSYYNAGRDGCRILYHYAVLQSILKRHTPKAIVLDVLGDELIATPDAYDRLSCLLPYYKTHKEIREVVDFKSDFERYKLLSAAYPFNSSIFTIIKGNSNVASAGFKGYIPLLRQWNKPLQQQPPYGKQEVDTLLSKYFDAFITTCKKADIKLYMVTSPSFEVIPTTPPGLVAAKAIAAKHNILFFDFSNDAYFTANGQLFQDVGHLNEPGAKIFSQKIVAAIKQQLH
jgi:hypothetical protein